VLGSVFALVSVGVLVAGAGLLIVDRTTRVDGFVTSDSQTFTSEGYAVVSNPIDFQVEGPDWPVVRSILGDVRIRATSQGQGGGEIFLGIAPASQTETYLQGVARSTFSDSNSSEGTAIAGIAPSAPPTDQDIWVAQASGPGTQSLTWSPGPGQWDLVAMNSDASRPVAVQADIGATIPWLIWLAVGLLILGVLLLALGTVLIAIPVHRASHDRQP